MTGRSGVGSAGHGQVAHEGDAAGGVVDAIAFAAAVAQDVPPLHVREGVFDAGAHAFVDGVELVLPGRQLGAVAGSPVGHDDLLVALVAAVGHHVRAPAGLVGTRIAECGAVVVVARHRTPDRDHQAGVGVDDDLHVHRVPVVLGRRGDRPIVDGDQRAVHDQHRVGAVPAGDRGECEQRRQVVDDPVRGRLGHPEQQRDLPQRQVGAVVHRDQQHPVGQRQAPPPTGAGLLTTATCHDPHQPAELPHRQASEHRHPLGLVRTDRPLHSKINDQDRPALRDSF